MIFDGTTIDALMILGLPDSELAPCKCGRKVYIHHASVCIGTSEYFCEICFPLHRDECGWCAANHFEKLAGDGKRTGLGSSAPTVPAGGEL